MLNKAFLIGYIATDPELRRVGEKKISLLKFRLGTDDSFKGDDGWRKVTDYHTIQMWGMAAEKFEQFANKGDLLYIEGKMKQVQYQAAGGEKKYQTVVDVFRHITLRSKDQPKSSVDFDHDNPYPAPEIEDDVPF